MPFVLGSKRSARMASWVLFVVSVTSAKMPSSLLGIGLKSPSAFSLKDFFLIALSWDRFNSVLLDELSPSFSRKGDACTRTVTSAPCRKPAAVMLSAVVWQPRRQRRQKLDLLANII